jgi:hypothetical protein
VDAEITIVAVGAEDTCEEYLGGVLANGFADVENCGVQLEGYTSVQGYVHNGGLVGLSDVNPKNRVHHGYVKGCPVDAMISFFENVEDRRAYCKPYVGETQNDALVVAQNETTRFDSRESKDYATILLPDMDENPVYDSAVTPPTCTEFGYTTYTNEKTVIAIRTIIRTPRIWRGTGRSLLRQRIRARDCGGRSVRFAAKCWRRSRFRSSSPPFPAN